MNPSIFLLWFYLLQLVASMTIVFIFAQDGRKEKELGVHIWKFLMNQWYKGLI